MVPVKTNTWRVWYPLVIFLTIVLLALIMLIPIADDKRVDVVVSVSSNALAVLLGGLVTIYFTTWQRHSDAKELLTQTAWDMHREFTSPQMLAARVKATTLLDTRFPGMSIRDIREAIMVSREAADPAVDAYAGFAYIVYFYQRLWMAIKYSRIGKEMVAPLFDKIFCDWWETQFRVRYEDTGGDISELKAWLDLNHPRKT